MDPETVTLTIDGGEEADDLTVPMALVRMLSEGDESVPTVVGDIAMLGLAQQAHGAVHHGGGDVSEELAATEELTMELFEERFGQTYAEVTGHSH
ncbi:MAG: hypothetical protein ABEH56_06810 [Salinirussus sp.]